MTKKTYFLELDNAPLSREEERQLLSRLKNHPSAEDRARLVTRNIRFVIATAMHYRGLGLPLEDLINEGNLGLMEAAKRYDPNRGTRFLTYAVWWIRKSILRALADHSIVRIPSYRQQQVKSALRAKRVLADEQQTSPRRQDVIDQLMQAVAGFDDLLRTTPRVLYLNEILGSSPERPIEDLIADQNAIIPEVQMIREENDALLQSAIGGLTGTESSIIRDRYGFGGKQPETLRQIAAKMGLSRERVRQIELQSREKIRRAIIIKRAKPFKKPTTPCSKSNGRNEQGYSGKVRCCFGIQNHRRNGDQSSEGKSG